MIIFYVMSETATLLFNAGTTALAFGGIAAGTYHLFFDESRAYSLLDGRPDRKTFYEQLDKGPYRERLKYNFWRTRYVKNYIKNNPVSESLTRLPLP
jgi:hypothetical protein